MNFKFCVLIFSCILQFTHGASLPSSIKPCKKSSPDLNKCVLEEGRKFFKIAVKGIPELKIPVLEPMKLGDPVLPAASNGVSLKAFDVKLMGLKKATIADIQFNMEKKTLMVQLKGTLKVAMRYDVNGVVAMMPINSKGKVEIKGTGLDIKMNMMWNLVKGKDNKDHLIITQGTEEFQVEHGQIKIDGLLSKEFDATMNSILNQNWRPIFNEFGKPSMKVLHEKTVTILNNMFAKIPYDDIFTA